MKDPTLKQGVINDLVLLACVGVKPVLVHGGGPEINIWLNKVGIEAVFKNGLRVTGARRDAPRCMLLHRVASLVAQPCAMCARSTLRGAARSHSGLAQFTYSLKSKLCVK